MYYECTTLNMKVNAWIEFLRHIFDFKRAVDWALLHWTNCHQLLLAKNYNFGFCARSFYVTLQFNPFHKML